jgi:hypothetical protein
MTVSFKCIMDSMSKGGVLGMRTEDTSGALFQGFKTVMSENQRHYVKRVEYRVHASITVHSLVLS